MKHKVARVAIVAVLLLITVGFAVPSFTFDEHGWRGFTPAAMAVGSLLLAIVVVLKNPWSKV